MLERCIQIGLLTLSAGLLLPLNACALAVHGRTQIIPFTSTPSGAEVIINGESKGYTPLELDLRRNQSYEVILRFEDKEQKIVITNIPESRNIALDVIPAGITGTFTLFICIDSLIPNPSNDTNDLVFDFSPLFCAASAAITAVAATPITVDAGNGAWFYLSPNEVSVNFDE